jgi:hypothetical protein
MTSALICLDSYHEVCDGVLSHIVRVTSDGTRVSFLDVETKEQSTQWMHTRSSNKPNEFKAESECHLFSGRGEEFWWWN